MAKQGFDVSGIDVSKSALRKAESLFEAERVRNVAAVCTSMSNLPFIGQAYDAVKEAIGKTVGEIHRVWKIMAYF